MTFENEVVTMRLWKILACLVALAGTTQSPAEAAPIELKGISPGMTQEDLSTKIPSLQCGQREGSINGCFLNLHSDQNRAAAGSFGSLADIRVESWTFELYDGRLARAVVSLVPGANPDALMEAVSIRFGRPQKLTTAPSNEIEWRDDGRYIQIRTYEATDLVTQKKVQRVAVWLGDSGLSVRYLQERKANYEARRRAGAEKRSGDL